MHTRKLGKAEADDPYRHRRCHASTYGLKRLDIGSGYTQGSEELSIGRRPDEGENVDADQEHPAPEDPGRVHCDEGSAFAYACRSGSKIARHAWGVVPAAIGCVMGHATKDPVPILGELVTGRNWWKAVRPLRSLMSRQQPIVARYGRSPTTNPKPTTSLWKRPDPSQSAIPRVRQHRAGMGSPPEASLAKKNLCHVGCSSMARLRARCRSRTWVSLKRAS